MLILMVVMLTMVMEMMGIMTIDMMIPIMIKCKGTNNEEDLEYEDYHDQNGLIGSIRIFFVA